MFLKNVWYVAAISGDIDRSLKAMTILDEPVVLYRRVDGKAVALEDACPHRKLPLSMGRLKGDEVECGYHGLTFNCSGSCTRAPGSERIPPGAKVRSYPVEDRYGLLWIWMGAPELANPDEIFKVEQWDNPAWGTTKPDSMTVECNYFYVTDNLLDPSHVAWVHQSSFASAGCEQTALSTKVNDNGVVVSRWMLGDEVAPFYAPFVKFKGLTDRQQHYEVRFPSHAIIKAIFTPAGTGGPEGVLHPDTFLMDSYNFMTPVSEGMTRYFWFQMRNFAPGDEAVSAAFAVAVKAAFEEDRLVLNAVQKGMSEKRTPNIDLAIDAGPLRFRRRVQQMIEAEAGQKAAAE
jgi:vanillate O-demethylase monooxygenase subunit